MNEEFEKFWEKYINTYTHSMEYSLSEEQIKKIAEEAFKEGHSIATIDSLTMVGKALFQ